MDFLDRVRKDFRFIKAEVDGILLFGSFAVGREDKRSDIDICLVRPRKSAVLHRVFEVLGNKYDVKVFEDLPLYIKMEVINTHRTVFGDEVELSSYFYRFRKEWGDMESRVKRNRFEGPGEMVRQRRIWLNDRKVSQKG